MDKKGPITMEEIKKSEEAVVAPTQAVRAPVPIPMGTREVQFPEDARGVSAQDFSLAAEQITLTKDANVMVKAKIVAQLNKDSSQKWARIERGIPEAERGGYRLIQALKTLKPPPMVGIGYKMQEIYGHFIEGVRYVVPTHVASHLVETGNAVMLR